MALSTTHRQVSPRECGTCTKIHSVLIQHQRRALGQPLTGAGIAAAAGISRQKSLIHVAHMVEWAWVAADRRTPIVQAAAAPLPVRTGAPITWATDAALSCRTCGRVLLLLASHAAPGDWFTQMSESDMAAALGIAERTLRDHLAALTGTRPHARHTLEAPMLRGERIAETGGRGGLKWVFLDGKARTGSLADDYSAEEYRALRTVALDILAQAPLITAKMTARERTSAAELLIIPRLHLGYPPAVILEAMTEPSDHEETVTSHAYGLIRHRLKKKASGPYVASAKLTYDRTPVVHDCADCGLPISAPLHVTHCGDCRRRAAAGLSLDVVEDAEARRLRSLREVSVS
ncbi:hypothetical protein ACFWSP_40145 [Streptomyces sp. NPDC058618]|uniref:hypothetical protein n=1 Tax=Streptomyces sp. NPDC058618 TaxID=3346558 RepID=UPI00366158CE